MTTDYLEYILKMYFIFSVSISVTGTLVTYNCNTDY